MFGVVWNSYLHIVVQDLQRLIITVVWGKIWGLVKPRKVNKLQIDEIIILLYLFQHRLQHEKHK